MIKTFQFSVFESMPYEQMTLFAIYFLNSTGIIVISFNSHTATRRFRDLYAEGRPNAWAFPFFFRWKQGVLTICAIICSWKWWLCKIKWVGFSILKSARHDWFTIFPMMKIHLSPWNDIGQKFHIGFSFMIYGHTRYSKIVCPILDGNVFIKSVLSTPREPG